MEIDKINTKKIILEFPKQFQAGLQSAKTIRIRGRFDGLTVCGMGGSAWPAEILKDWLRPSFPFYINKSYHLPPQTGKNLVTIVSYSGNTEEALSCYEEAKKRSLKLVGLSTGGKLKELCKKDKNPFVLIPDNVPAPRLGCGYTFAALFKILKSAGLIKKGEKEIVSMAKKLNPASQEKNSQILAKKINSRIPIIYASDRFKALAYVWKIKFNETSKVPAFCNYFPEMNHNELSAYSEKNDFFVIFLKDRADHPKILKRMSLTSAIIKARNMPVEIIELRGANLLEKIFNSIALSDMVSYYLALKKGVDPLSVKLQEELKKKL